MNRLFFISLLFLVLVGCRKKVIPDKEFLIGKWVEIPVATHTYEFTENDTLYFTLSHNPTDTRTYWLEEDNKVLHTESIRYQLGSQIKIRYERKTGNLILFGLNVRAPESKPSENIFEKRN